MARRDCSGISFYTQENGACSIQTVAYNQANLSHLVMQFDITTLYL